LHRKVLSILRKEKNVSNKAIIDSLGQQNSKGNKNPKFQLKVWAQVDESLLKSTALLADSDLIRA